MLPFVGSTIKRAGRTKLDSNIVTVDVGGQIFQTTKQTLTQAGPKSLYSVVSESHSGATGHLPSKAKAFDLQDLISESQFYGIEPLLLNSLLNPSQFEAFNLKKSMVLPLNGRDSPSTITTAPCGSVHVAHGSKIISFDWSLRRKSTILTQFTAVDSLLALSPFVAAAGATDVSGLQILDLQTGNVKKSLNWENATRSSSTVQAIGSSPEFLFSSFESGRLSPVMEIDHSEIYGAEIESAIPATKLIWVSGYSLLMASGSHSGLSGVLGNINFWDIRSGNKVWEFKETVDCFSDVTVSDNLSRIFKVGVNSGELFFADMRNVGRENPWVCLGDRGKVPVNGKKKVFCSKRGEIEMWTEVVMGCSKKSEDGLENRVFRKNLMGRMFVTRKDRQNVEVWQSSARGF
ncbi:hypothetical protein I3843_12G091600 [Carya illinoinensis]|nr:hypothetical protein I3843_12G091600 [Carya illinoinensis]